MSTRGLKARGMIGKTQSTTNASNDINNDDDLDSKPNEVVPKAVWKEVKEALAAETVDAKL